MKTASKVASFNPRVLVGFALCSVGLLLALAGLSKSVTATAVTTPDSTQWYVNGVTGSDSNDCKSATTACKTIRHAISLTASRDSIKVAAATYTENLTIGVNLTITGADPSTTIIDGGGVGTVVTINAGTVTLSRFTIQNGSVRGITNLGTLRVSNSNISGNTYSTTFRFVFGGGVYNSGTLTINNSTLSGNTAVCHDLGEGIADGGGIYNTGTLTINSSTLNGNAAEVPFPAMNGSASGGGIFSTGTLTINNSTISGNSASSYLSSALGGGISAGGPTTINNSTLSGNGAFSGGGGIYSGGASVILQNTIVTNSTFGGNCGGGVTSDGYNLSSDNTCGFNNTGDLNNTDPMLGPLQNNGGPTDTQALLTGSPAIDAGNPGGCTDGLGRLLKTDQRHMPRPDHEDTSGCDMGAYESQSD